MDKLLPLSIPKKLPQIFHGQVRERDQAYFASLATQVQRLIDWDFKHGKGLLKPVYVAFVDGTGSDPYRGMRQRFPDWPQRKRSRAVHSLLSQLGLPHFGSELQWSQAALQYIEYEHIDDLT